jgi:carbonic anhydrase/acetyltransferase-like protein (isoleucine patch superfamily)
MAANVHANVHENVVTSFNPQAKEPDIDPTAYVHPLAAVIGDTHIGRRVMVSPGASVRGDEGQPLWVGDGSNVQDGVIIHALETWEDGAVVEGNLVEHDGQKFAVYVGNNVSLAHQAQIHGPAKIGDDTFIGMQTLVFKAQVGKGCVVEPKCLLLGVKVSDGRYVPAGSVIGSQAEADALPEITEDYAFKHLNEGVLHVNVQLADGYNKAR